MDQEETIKRLLNTIDELNRENDRLRHENELLRGCIIGLEARLTQYEKAHTPPSLRRGGSRKKNHDEGEKESPAKRLGIKA